MGAIVRRAWRVVTMGLWVEARHRRSVSERSRPVVRLRRIVVTASLRVITRGSGVIVGRRIVVLRLAVVAGGRRILPGRLLRGRHRGGDGQRQGGKSDRGTDSVSQGPRE